MGKIKRTLRNLILGSALTVSAFTGVTVANEVTGTAPVASAMAQTYSGPCTRVMHAQPFHNGTGVELGYDNCWFLGGSGSYSYHGVDRIYNGGTRHTVVQAYNGAGQLVATVVNSWRTDAIAFLLRGNNILACGNYNGNRSQYYYAIDYSVPEPTYTWTPIYLRKDADQVAVTNGVWNVYTNNTSLHPHPHNGTGSFSRHTGLTSLSFGVRDANCDASDNWGMAINIA